jgi:hypothetical protein
MYQKPQSTWHQDFANKWQMFTPPARPSEGELAHYERAVLSLTEFDPDTWVLLGCTPEIRSLAGKYQREILCIDESPHVFHALRSLCEIPPEREKFICSDWLDATTAHHVDIVFGDGSINMLQPFKHEALLQKIHAMIKPQGLALLRVHVVTPASFENPGQVFRWYRKHYAHKPVFWATKTHLDMLWIDPDTLRQNMAEYPAKFQQLFNDGIINEVEFAEYDRLLGNNKLAMYYTREETFEHLASKYFDIIGVHYGKDYPVYKSHPVYCLKKKAET